MKLMENEHQFSRQERSNKWSTQENSNFLVQNPPKKGSAKFFAQAIFMSIFVESGQK